MEGEGRGGRLRAGQRERRGAEKGGEMEVVNTKV